jgi:hypothetical protein
MAWVDFCLTNVLACVYVYMRPQRSMELHMKLQKVFGKPETSQKSISHSAYEAFRN